MKRRKPNPHYKFDIHVFEHILGSIRYPKFIDTFMTLKSCRLVCKRWYELLTTKFVAHWRKVAELSMSVFTETKLTEPIFPQIRDLLMLEASNDQFMRLSRQRSSFSFVFYKEFLKTLFSRELNDLDFPRELATIGTRICYDERKKAWITSCHYGSYTKLITEERVTSVREWFYDQL